MIFKCLIFVFLCSIVIVKCRVALDVRRKREYSQIAELEAPADASDYVESLPDPPLCGQSGRSHSHTRVKRIVGGFTAARGEFPFMALLGYSFSNGFVSSTEWSCGGSLISRRHVLTAGHCADPLMWPGLSRLNKVRLGELDVSKKDEVPAPVDVSIKKSITHPEYSTDQHDIAILVLKEDVQFTETIKPICLPRSSLYRNKTFEGYNPIAAGWGDLSYRGKKSDVLRAVHLPVISKKVCQQAYANMKEVNISNRVLCAGYLEGGSDTCMGDSGGPLVHRIRDRRLRGMFYYQLGVVSQGLGCALPGKPGLSTRVTTFVPWIEETVLGRVENT